MSSASRSPNAEISEIEEQIKKELDEINRKIDYLTVAESLFDGFYVGTVGRGLYNKLLGKDTMVEREVGDIVLKYRAELAELRGKYEMEKKDFLNSNRKRLNGE